MSDLFGHSPPQSQDEGLLQVRNRLSSLTAALREFVEAYSTEPNQVLWLRDGSRGSPHDKVDFFGREAGTRVKLLEAVLATTYRAGQSGAECYRWPGLVAAYPHTLLRLRQLNQAKDELAQALRAVAGPNNAERQRRKLLFEPYDKIAASRELRGVLRGYGSGRLHVTQATRRIPILEAAPQYVGFFWAAKPTHIKTLSKDLAAQVAARTGREEQFHDAIEGAAPHKVLRLRSAMKPHLRANLRWDVEGEESIRKVVLCSMPLFYPATGEGGDTPEFNVPDLEPPKPDVPTRQSRSDKAPDLVEVLPGSGIYLGSRTPRSPRPRRSQRTG